MPGPKTYLLKTFWIGPTGWTDQQLSERGLTMPTANTAAPNKQPDDSTPNANAPNAPSTKTRHRSDQMASSDQPSLRSLGSRSLVHSVYGATGDGRFRVYRISGRPTPPVP